MSHYTIICEVRLKNDTKQSSDARASGMRSTPSLPSLQGPLCLRVEAPDKGPMYVFELRVEAPDKGPMYVFELRVEAPDKGPMYVFELRVEAPGKGPMYVFELRVEAPDKGPMYVFEPPFICVVLAAQ